MIIRRYRPSDRKAVEHIHFETGFLGKSMDSLLENRKYWAEEAAYYLDKEPQSILVAEHKGKVVGYIFGCLDDKKRTDIQWVLSQLRHVARLPFMHRKDRLFWWRKLRWTMRIIFTNAPEKKYKTPPDCGHIHINLLPEARGKGTGTKLLKAFEKYAKEHGVKLIRAGSTITKRNPNTNFWKKNKFAVYSQTPSSFWSDEYPNDKMYAVCYVKKL